MELGTAITAIIAALGAGGFGTWLLRYLADRRKERVEDGDKAWVRYDEVFDRVQKQLAVQQERLDQSLAGEMKCRQQLARQRTISVWLYGLVKNLHAALVKHGGDPGPLPDFPAEEDVSETTRAEKEFVRRASEHTTGLLQQEIKDMRRENTDIRRENSE